MKGKLGSIIEMNDGIINDTVLTVTLPDGVISNPKYYNNVPIDAILADYYELKIYLELIKKAADNACNAAKEAALMMYEPEIKEKLVNGVIYNVEDLEQVIQIYDDLEIKIKMVESVRPKIRDYRMLKEVLGDKDFDKLVEYNKSKRFTFTALKPKI